MPGEPLIVNGQQLPEQEGQELYTRLSKSVPSKGWDSLTDDAKRKRITQLRRQVEGSRLQRITQMLQH
jgi:hypothetical protein